jgi:hypothetical protein
VDILVFLLSKWWYLYKMFRILLCTLAKVEKRSKRVQGECNVP